MQHLIFYKAVYTAVLLSWIRNRIEKNSRIRKKFIRVHIPVPVFFALFEIKQFSLQLKILANNYY